MGWFDGKYSYFLSSSLICFRHISTTTSNRDPDDSNQAQAYEQVTQRPHEAEWSHELIGGAAAFEAAKAYEEHAANNGKSRTRITRPWHTQG